MINNLAKGDLTRCTALLLAACLLTTGALSTPAPEREGGVDELTAYVQVARAPALRQAPAPGPGPIALLVRGDALPLDRVVRDAHQHGSAVVVLRPAQRPNHLSRAPPPSL